MSKTSSTENISPNKTVKINESVYLDAATNMVIIVVDRVTMTLTLQEYITLSTDIIKSANYIQQYVAIKSSISELASRGFISKSAQSGSAIF
tara:strand:+ start:1559 stop:1834 length:276 start_codon:yes stop_codon:yes gene_type:complete